MTLSDNFGFEDGSPVPIAWPSDHEAGEVPEADAARLRQETLCRFLAFITAKKDARQVGRRVLLLAFLLRVGDCRTQRALARRLKVTEGAISQKLKSLKREFARLSRG